GREPFDASTEHDEETVLETNVHGLIRMTRLCLPHIRDEGHIVNMGSIAGLWAYPNGALYCTSKFAVEGFTRALREDLLGRPIRICDERGDVEGETAGFFADDTRHLSLFRLTVNGQRPLLLSSGKVEYFSAAFYLRNPLAGDLPQDAVSIVRTRFVGDGMQDRF